MTKEELKFQCFRTAQDNQGGLTAIQNGEKRKSIGEIIADAQKIYDWVILGSGALIKN